MPGLRAVLDTVPAPMPSVPACSLMYMTCAQESEMRLTDPLDTSRTDKVALGHQARWSGPLLRTPEGIVRTRSAGWVAKLSRSRPARAGLHEPLHKQVMV